MRKLLVGLAAFLLFTGQLLAQRVISGTVTDDKGAPVQGVSVQVKGTGVGTTTAQNGAYTLSLPAGATVLVFSSVDYTPQEITIGDQTVINSRLVTVENTMQEVVVVGYGTVQRRNFTGSAAKIDVKEFSNLLTPSVDKQLAGRAPGVQVTNSGGLVNTPATIRVRGINSINQNRSPLIVLDGTPMLTGNPAGASNSNLLGDINPADIESMDVLKDGAATAIFGSRAAGGVIMITTKKGSKGRVRVSYDGFLGFSSPREGFGLLNADQFVTIANEKFTNAVPAQAPRASVDPNGVNTDWQDVALVSAAPIQNHTLSVQGGNDRTQYYMSIGYSDQQGIIKSNFNKAYRVRMNLDHEVNKFFKIGNYTTLSRQENGDQNNGSNALSGAIASALRLLPNVSPYNPNHPTGYNINYPTGNSMNPGPNTTSVDDNFTNVAFTINENKFYADNYRLINNSYVEISPIRGLKLKSVFNWDFYSDYSYSGTSPFHGDGYGTSTGGTNGRIVNTSQNNTRFIWQNYANYNLTIKDHSFFATVGYELSMSKNKNFSLNNNNISDAFFIQQNFITGTATIQTTSGGISESAFESMFARLNYDYKGKYYAMGTFRRDAQSSFAPELRNAKFPGFSVGWRPAAETFWQNSAFLSKWIPEAKIKASYAEVGQEIGGFPYLTNFNSRPYGNIPGISVGAIGNPVVQWETSAKYDIGIDLGIWNNRLNFTFDWFHNDIDNLILSVPTPLSVGIPGNSIEQNIATMNNKGIELSLGGNVLQKGDFRWDFNVNYTNVKNKITSLYDVGGVPVPFIQPNGFNIIQVGDPINILYGNRWAGVNASNGHPVYYKADGSLVQLNLSAGGSIGAYYVATGKDDPGLGAQSNLTFADRANLGQAIPIWFGALTNTLTWKGLTLDFMLRYSGGNSIMNITRQEALLNQSFQNNGTEILQRWTTPGQITNVPKLYYGQGNNINQTQVANSRFVEKGDFLRLQNVVLSYNLPATAISRITGNFVSGIRIYAQGQNLAVWTAYTGADPENINEFGHDNAVSPQIRTYSFGLQVGF